MTDFEKNNSYPILKKFCYLNTAATGLISNKIFQAARESALNLQYNASQYRNHFMLKIVPTIKTNIAEFINADNNEIALVPNVSWPCNALAESLQSFSNIAYLEDDYPSLTLPFINRKYHTTCVYKEEDHSFSLSTIDKNLAENKIEILLVSHVQWQSGFRIDLKELGAICKKNNCLLLVDATQSFGAFPIDVKDLQIDILIASGYKWLGAGFGNGILYIQSELLDKLQLNTAGYNSCDLIDEKIHLSKTMRLFEPGHLDHEAFSRLHAAVSEHQSIGIEEISLKIKTLNEHFISTCHDKGIGLKYHFDVENQSGIRFLKGNETMINQLEAQHILASYRNSSIRISFHFYNQTTDIDRFIKVYQSLL